MNISLPRHIDSTMISCFRQCPQKFWLEFANGYRHPGISIDLHAGGAFADAREKVARRVYDEGMSLDRALILTQIDFMNYWGDFEIPPWKKTSKTKDRTWEAVESYFAEYPPGTDKLQPYRNPDGTHTFEFTFAVPLDFEGFPEHPDGGPFLYSGRLDMLGTLDGRRPVASDDKTTGGSISSGWAEQWDLRSQFLGYVWSMQQLGFDLDTVVVRGIAIQKTQFTHAEAIKTYDNHRVQKWFSQLRRDMNRMVECYKESYFDFNLADACSSYGGCSFRDVCASANPEAWLGNFARRFWNPLLKDPTSDPRNTEPTT